MTTTRLARTPLALGERARAVLYLRVSTKEQAERGGEAEGFSIPAQREAGYRKAEQLNADVVAEFVDAGESARSADRPDLQRMLQYLQDNPTHYVIAHKVDRLARNRIDDVEINLGIRQAGATFVSCTENIDETPSGMLLHGIMSSIAEFYSRNLANEVIKGTQQKVQAGGTPTLAPIGYLNVRKVVDGREVRTIELDPERAPLIAWAFETYATGEWSLRGLAHELEVRGLTQRPTAKRAARPLDAKKLGQVLHNSYYVGTVTWRGMQFEGKHLRLISVETFARVQDVLAAHQQSGERSYRHKHYLAGTLYCGECESKLIYGVSQGRAGTAYGYWFCIGRHTYKNGCELPYLAEEVVEQKVVQQWQLERFSDQQAAIIREGLLADLEDHTRATNATALRLDRRIDSIRRERRKWAEKAMDGTVPDDIAREKQQELARQLVTAETQRSKLSLGQANYEQVIRDATALLPSCGEAYGRGDNQLRRDYNQAWFNQIYLSSRDGQPVITRVQRTELFEALHTAEVLRDRDADNTRDVFQDVLTADQDAEKASGEGSQTRRCGSFRHRVSSCVRGSKVALLVDLRGRLSNPEMRKVVDRAARAIAERPTETGARPAARAVRPRRNTKHHRLPEEERAALISAYRSGVFIKELARQYGVHRTTVTAILLRAGEPLRRPGLSGDQVEEAARLYRGGWSLARLGTRFGVDAATVFRTLRRNDVQMRSSYERMKADGRDCK